VDLCIEANISLIGIDEQRQLIQPSLPIAKERILSDFFGAQ
jgi:hypothetical protein